MSKQTIHYKGKTITIEGQEAEAQIMVDGQLIPVQFDPATSRYMAFDYLAYSDYTTPLGLAKAIVDSK